MVEELLRISSELDPSSRLLNQWALGYSQVILFMEPSEYQCPLLPGIRNQSTIINDITPEYVALEVRHT